MIVMVKQRMSSAIEITSPGDQDCLYVRIHRQRHRPHGVVEKDVDLIQKPFIREGLATRVREVLDRKQG